MNRCLLFAVAGVATLATAGPLHAQGSAVMTHSSCATALGGAQVGQPCADGSAVLFNPAAIASMPSTLGIGWTGITTSAEFTYDRTGEVMERDASTTSVPFGFVTHRLNERVGIGLGVFAPYGLTIDWPLEFEGRFVGYDNSLTNIYIQPTIAINATPWLSVGAGVDYVRADIEINQRADLATTPTGSVGPAGAPILFGNLGIPLGTDFADIGLAGDGSGWGFHVAALARFSEMLSIGARYMSQVEIDYDGTATFEQINTDIVLAPGNPLDPEGTTPLPLDVVLSQQFGPGGPLSNQGIATSLTLPDQFVVGVGLRPSAAILLNADYQWTGWSDFGEATILFENAATVDQVLVLDYQNAHTFRLGGSLGATDALTVRAGFIYNTAAQKEFSVGPLLPEAERNYYSLGLGYRLTDSIGIDAGYQLVDQSDRRGRVRGRPASLTDPAQLEALNVGVYSADAHVLNFTLSYQFGSMR